MFIAAGYLNRQNINMILFQLNGRLYLIYLIFQGSLKLGLGDNFTANDLIEKQRQLHVDLMAKYNPYIMPPLINNGSKIVTLSVYILALEEVNVRGQSFKARAYVKIEWNDRQFKWDSKKYAGTTQIYIPNERIWKPDPYLISSFGLDLGLEGVLANIQHDGNVQVWAFCVQTVSCDINIKAYPFDFQECAFDFGSWTHPVSEIIFESHQTTIDDSIIAESGEWHFIPQNIRFLNYSFENVTYHSISFPFRIHRKILANFMNTLTPCILTSILTVTIFKLPTESGERISLSITLFLTTAVFMTVVNDSLPRNSDQVSILEIYLTIQLISSVLAIMLTIHSISLLHMDLKGPLPWYIKQVMKRFGKRFKLPDDIDNDMHRSSKSSDIGRPTHNNLMSRESNDIGTHNNLMSRESNDFTSDRKSSYEFEAVQIAKTFDRLYFYVYVVEFMGLHLWLLAVGISNSYTQ